MYNVREISPQIYWIGGNDRRLEQFENLFPLTNGVSYNSWLILDEKTAIIDTVDDAVTDQYLENIEHLMQGRELDYLIINHMEPDHCGNIENLVRRYPNVKVVGNKKSFQLFNQFYNMDITDNQMLVGEGDEISLGKHNLKIITAPMVHWPEVMMNYETTEGILFAADAFGTFGALTGNLFDDEVDYRNLYLDESRRYYANIVGKFGAQVQSVFRKISSFKINMICSLHGPIFRSDLNLILDLYDKWSKYEPEKEGVVIFYGSMYGNTANTADALANKLGQRGVKDIRVYDVSKTHPSYIISDIWKYSHLVAAAPTYNMGLYYPMDNLLHEMAALGVKNRKVAIIGNHSWSSAAQKLMTERFSSMKNMEIIGETFDIKSRLKDDEEQKLDDLADVIAASVLGNTEE
ncbi:FprA family A-type flavoprotein [Proteiniclasticum sp. SCR006]|uniref:FprA family A-type flavoprotein n=1 Tax=Proteiniclasticum aestuarii TaxID=2817862 RepID=A0A939H7V2_9CLOT|nr:FprA family A-type flavoprotein [Proteiniclasticum aestuarii]MBO1263613.1 FprA family A-type flavoprotein [Proteiniclasticum aestuarii]